LQLSLSSFNPHSPNRRFLSTAHTKNTSDNINNNSYDSNTISTNNETLATSVSSPESEMAKFEQLANQSTETITSSSNPLWEPIWWYPQDHFVNLINFVHETSGLNYTFTIAAITLILRTAMLPVFISAQQNSARMAHLSPELRILQDKQKRVDPSDTQAQMQMAKQFQALFKKYNVNPLKTLAGALLQFPAFMGMFLALRKMPEIFPDQLRDGGILWFQDLTMADPTLILPISSSISFLLMIEAGKQQMMSTNPQQGQIMLNVMRGLAVVMIPATMNFPTAVFCYWTTNNTFSLLQSVAFQNATVRKALDIWDLPKPVPGALPPKGVMESFNEMMDKRRKDQEERSMKEKIQLHNAAIDAKTKAELIKNDSDDARNSVERRKRRRGRK
jgi:YidC/Oxa1 family membrane protein insertase